MRQRPCVGVVPLLLARKRRSRCLNASEMRRWSNSPRLPRSCKSSALRPAVWSQCSKPFCRTRRAFAMHDAPQPVVEEWRKNPIIRPAPTTTLGRALATKRPVQIADVLNEPQYFNVPSGYTSAKLAKLAGARTILAVPMLKENELIGAIVIYRQEVHPFTD